MNNYGGTEKFKKQVEHVFRSTFDIDLKGYHLVNKEGRQVAVKHDRRFLDTGRLFITVQGRKDGKNMPLGVYNPNFALLVIGTENHFYIFSTDHLKKHFATQTYKLFKGARYKYGIDQYGVLLPLKRAESLSISKMLVDNNGLASTQAKLF